MSRCTNGLLFAVIAAALLSWKSTARAQEATDRAPAAAAAAAPAAAPAAEEEEHEEELEIKVYRVIDLVSPVPNYPYTGTYLPKMSGTPSGSLTYGGMPVQGGGMGGMGGGMGGMGGGGFGGGGMGGGGGGMFRVADDTLWQLGGVGRGQAAAGGASPAPSPLRIDMGRLIETITSLVVPDSWEESGGPGSISPIGGALAVSQTPTVHAKLEKFLGALRRESGTVSTLSIEGQWLLLDGQQLAQLRGPKTDAKTAMGRTLNRQALAALPDEARRHKGQITCFNGQTVHLVSGRMETKLQGAIPVVGSSPAYQPIIVTPHLGALLQITAALLPGDEGALVDLFGSVTEWGKPAEPVKLNGAEGSANPAVEVDRINVNAQQLATSLRVPLGKPVLVGGMTMAGDGPGHQDPRGRQLYLVLEITAAGE
ncbi:MAG: hypothetical protein HYX69_02870 [Planctomycetia bacterium]|nr:hypothetical protein [Planctomycetia bacterium]